MHRRITPVFRLLAAGVLTLSLAGVATAADTAMVRVLHASPDAPAVDVYLDDTIVDALTNVPFGTISGYLEIPAGDHNVKVYATGTTEGPVIDAGVTVATGAKYTIAATGAVASITAQVLQDEPAPDCESASVRVVHFSADAPAVDVATAGAAPADAVVKNLAYPNASDYVALPAGSYDLEVRLAGTTTVALALPDVAVEACNAYSVFAIGSAATPAVGDNALQVAVAVDATATDDAGATPPPTDTIASAGSTTSDGSGPAAALLLVVGLVSFAVIARRPATSRVRQDEG
jgi:hypothetical protein